MSVGKRLPAATLLLAISACTPDSPEAVLSEQAEEYVSLALSLGRLHPKEIDAFFGPAALDNRNSSRGPSRTEILEQASELKSEVEQLALESERKNQLLKKLTHFLTLLEMMELEDHAPFQDEAERLYQVMLPETDSSRFDSIRDELAEILPGRGNLAYRLALFRNQFVIPADKREAVFEAALAECRKRTETHWQLPANHALEVEWTRDVPAAWHEYQGDGRSLLRLNALALGYLDSAINVACHEGYPGHHAQFLILENREQELYVENTLYLLRSPEAILREGAADYGVDLVFPAAERTRFEAEVLMPMAGVPAEQAALYTRVNALARELALSVIPIVQEYHDELIPHSAANYRLEREALVASPRQLLEFIDEYGAYSVGYTLIHDKMSEQVPELAVEKGLTEWQVLQEILETMQLD